MNVYLQIIAYSVVPLIGILMFGWDWREVILLYWLENIIVGLVALVQAARTTNITSKLEFPNNTSAPQRMNIQFPPVVVKLYSCIFFLLHYGIFTAVHGVFVFMFINGDFGFQTQASLPALNYMPIVIVWVVMLVIQVGRVLIQPAPDNSISEIISKPYKRIIPLHITIIAGGFAITVLELPAAAALLLVVLHAAFDIFSGLSKRIESPATILK